jgi:cellulose synthase/poly-beta-1,6-N-acetylglucosamine synthase-like glycosyltransferase
VQFLDGDCILQPEWIPSALEFLQSYPDVAAVCGRRFEAHPKASIYNELCDQEWSTPVGEASECGGDALIRCVALDEVGGYDSRLLAGEEPEMAARMRAAGWRIWRIDVAMTEHDANIHSLGQWWRRTQRGGFGYAQVWCATKGLPQRLYGHQLRSAITWAIAVPLLIVVSAILLREPLILLLLALAYGLQFLRIALNGRSSATPTAAALILLAKLPETIGAARFLLAGGQRRVPEYKS